ncbi:uncharacterized protein LOC143793664 [Ranitomeya variabilis]|uniref:uncharacterized protein LOC143793664 n=1 Tax=Ranitomeya variabilis TaxID=490064 RepID=UPI0040566BAC
MAGRSCDVGLGQMEKTEKVKDSITERQRCDMAGSRGNNSESWNALLRFGMPWRINSPDKVFHRSLHLESIRWYAAQHMAGGSFLHILGSTAGGIMPRRSIAWPYRNGRHLAWNEGSYMVPSLSGSCACCKSSVFPDSGGYSCRRE